MQYLRELEVVLPEIMRRWDVPGLAVGIAQGDEIVYSGGFGVQSLATQAPMTLDTVFCVQSISKCFVATAVMQLVEQGLLELDGPLVRYLPNLAMADDRYQQITLRQALSHTSGMPDIDESDYIEWMARPEYDDGSAERFVRGLRDLKLVANPGERFSYSNIAYNVLGALLANVTAESFEDLMRQRVLDPSGMAHSTFRLDEIPADLLAWPHLRSPAMKPNPVYPYQRADAPSSFLHATVADMCRWGTIGLRRGRNQGQRILTTGGYELMWSPVAKRGEPPSLYEEMGLGWTLGHHKGERTVSHGGAGFGWTAFFLIMPEKDCAAIVFCNDESSACSRATRAIADVLVGQRPQVNTVSWMVPISRALAAGGIEAAHECYQELRDNGAEDIYFDAYDLLGLELQLLMAGQNDLAIDVLGLNITAFPDHADSYAERARLHRQMGADELAQEDLARALAIEHHHTTATRLLALMA